MEQRYSACVESRARQRTGRGRRRVSMKIVGRLAGLAAIAALLYGTTYFTRGRADPSWSAPAAKALAAKPAEAPAAGQASGIDKAVASSQSPCEGQAWPKIAPECIAGAGASKEVRVI